MKATALLVRTRTRCDAGLLEGSSIRFIGTATIGTDHINLDWCRQKGIRVASAPGCNAGAVMQYVASAIVSYCNVRQCNPREKVLGIVGLGHVGSRVKRLGEALGMEVIVNDPPLQQAGAIDQSIPLHEIIRRSDIISLHVPYSESGPFATRQLINRDNIVEMRPDACLIQTSRGGVIDERAVAGFRDRNRNFCYVADVWENEPHINREFLNQCFLSTPHIAGYSIDGKRNATQALLSELAGFFNWPAVPAVATIHPPDDSVIIAGSLEEALLKIYPIQTDDSALRQDPSRFEEIRDHYRFRHEYPNYMLRLPAHLSEKYGAAAGLGFITETQ